MNPNHAQSQGFGSLVHNLRLQRGLAFGVIIIAALFAFEAFNYSTTDFALSDLIGDLKFMGIRWATILSIAFCGIDFAGIARLFTPEDGGRPQNETWYLFGAWMLAAAMNAILTWWGVSIAVLSQQTLGNVVVSREVLLRAVPIFVATMVWLIRILIIGTFSVAGDRLFSQAGQRLQPMPQQSPRVTQTKMPAHSLNSYNQPAPRAAASSGAFRPAQKTNSGQLESGYGRQDPTYHPVMSAAPPTNNGYGQNRQGTPPRSNGGYRS